MKCEVGPLAGLLDIVAPFEMYRFRVAKCFTGDCQFDFLFTDFIRDAHLLIPFVFPIDVFLKCSQCVIVRKIESQAGDNTP